MYPTRKFLKKKIIFYYIITLYFLNNGQIIKELGAKVGKTRQFDDRLRRPCNAVYYENPIDSWMKGCILPFLKKGDLGLAKNYRGIKLTSIAAKIYDALQRNRIEPKIYNILRRTKIASGEIDPGSHKYWLSSEFLKAYGHKTYRQQYYLSTLQRPLIPYTEGILRKVYSHMVY